MGDGQVLVVLAAGRAKRYGGVKPLAPVGSGGEPVIDLLAGDALAAGFSTIVLVVGPSTGPAIRYHVERVWPQEVDVRFALQEAPLGTVHAVLASAAHLDEGQPFGVANADDLYGRGPLSQLAAHLRAVESGDVGARGASNAIVGFRLANALIGNAPVTRGVCDVDDDGRLRAIVERRRVARGADGRISADDGLDPVELDGDAIVSMNLWAFGPALLEAMAEEMDDNLDASEEAEVLLPDLVGKVLSGARATRGAGHADAFEVIVAEGRCIGVTHPDDLALVQADVAGQVGRGDRPALPFAAWHDPVPETVPAGTGARTRTPGR